MGVKLIWMVYRWQGMNVSGLVCESGHQYAMTQGGEGKAVYLAVTKALKTVGGIQECSGKRVTAAG